MAGPTYTYTVDTPQAPQQFNLSQPEILANFQAINELISVNHTGFNIPNDFGKHKFVQMPFQTEDPETAENVIAMYTKATGSPNVAEIFYRYPGNGEVVEIKPVVNRGFGTAYNVGDIQVAVQFPSGFILKYASNNTGSSGNTDITYTATAPQFKYIPVVLSQGGNITSNNTGGVASYIENGTQSGCTIRRSNEVYRFITGGF